MTLLFFIFCISCRGKLEEEKEAVPSSDKAEYKISSPETRSQQRESKWSWIGTGVAKTPSHFSWNDCGNHIDL
jgi:hypothetical protein